MQMSQFFNMVYAGLGTQLSNILFMMFSSVITVCVMLICWKLVAHG